MEEGPVVGGTPSGMPSGSNRASDRQEYYTVSEAAKILDISERRVRQIAQDGKIEGVRTEDGWKLFRYSVHDFRDHRAVQPPTRGAAREEPSEVREWIERVAALERELGRLEGRNESGRLRNRRAPKRHGRRLSNSLRSAKRLKRKPAGCVRSWRPSAPRDSGKGSSADSFVTPCG